MARHDDYDEEAEYLGKGEYAIDDDYDDFEYERYRGSYYPPSTPRAAKGGIKARSKRGGFVESWWGQRWIATLESFGLGSRLTRGRNYARRGQVVHLEIQPGAASAAVQGSRPRPYSVTIAVRKIEAKQRRKLGVEIAADLAIAARLIAGELPAEIEQCFERAGAPLFPQRFRDLSTHCSCPDSSNPCKHIAAVYYLMAEEFDRDPFLLLTLRGLPRDEFIAMLGAAAPAKTGEPPHPAAEPQPLAAEPNRFWRGQVLPAEVLGELAAGDEAAPLARRLGAFPLWRGDEDFLEEIGRLSRQAAARALEVLVRSSR
jgi:uncharacterized Zn finger protein